ncbi:MAG: polyribonucleotide nucleotidyltransferase [Epsilonproteobacteria bacterium]|nr:polyribonucleotide nucleotidyltransferase [Campylobacterota bacterium]
MSEKIINLEVNNIHESFTFHKVAKQADGAVWYKCGDAVLLATVAIDKNEVDEDFTPLTVQYIEKAYAAARIPSGFMKRESKQGDFETLTSRLIDRSIRPLLSKEFKNPTVITVTVFSTDYEVDMQLASLHAVGAAIAVSSIPVDKFISGVRIGKINGEIVLNPTISQQSNSTLDLFIAGSVDTISMIEMGVSASEVLDNLIPSDIGMPPLLLEHQECNELTEEELLSVIGDAQNFISEASQIYFNSFKEFHKEKIVPKNKIAPIDEALFATIKERYSDEVESAIQSMSKSERSNALEELMDTIASELKIEDKTSIYKIVQKLKHDILRLMIIDKSIRADGRALDEVRDISIETNLLPSVHGSALFTRGQTQALVTATLGDSKDAQSYELITSKSSLSENFMVHYNFPAFSVGEARKMGAPSRRELGHGNLAKKALEPVLDIRRDGTIRLVSEILESNGSSSMATVCGGSLALVASGVEIKKLVAGVAMGLVMDKDGRYAVLTDIMGLEDFEGDMDFKVTGTSDGITALQLDIKLDGLNQDILRVALNQAKTARLHILNLMESASANIIASKAIPKVEHFFVDTSAIATIIGKAGATIRDIIERFDVSIDISRDDGKIKITGQDGELVVKAKEHIESIAVSKTPMIYEVNKHYQGKIKKILEFGMFIEMPDGYDALLHISKVSKKHIDKLDTMYKVGDSIEVVVMEQKGKKVELATPEYIKG